MGVTSLLFPDESCPQGDCDFLRCNPFPEMNDDGEGVVGFTDFMTFLAPPPRGPVTGAAIHGEFVFNRLGCGSCHLSTLRTGQSEVAALDERTSTRSPTSCCTTWDLSETGSRRIARRGA
jgi:hypothetical protein